MHTRTDLTGGQGVTTGSFSGEVTDHDGGPLPGAVVTAVNEPTGTHYNAVTRANGRYSIFNVRVGGPYKLTATMTGFKTQTVDNIFVKLGEDEHVNFQLELETIEETL